MVERGRQLLQTTERIQEEEASLSSPSSTPQPSNTSSENTTYSYQSFDTKTSVCQARYRVTADSQHPSIVNPITSSMFRSCSTTSGSRLSPQDITPSQLSLSSSTSQYLNMRPGSLTPTESVYIHSNTPTDQMYSSSIAPSDPDTNNQGSPSSSELHSTQVYIDNSNSREQLYVGNTKSSQYIESLLTKMHDLSPQANSCNPTTLEVEKRIDRLLLSVKVKKYIILSNTMALILSFMHL